MGILDIIILAVFVVSAIYGFWRGVVVQVGALAAVVVGILACRLFGEWATSTLANILPTMSSSPELAHYTVAVIAYALLFVLGYVLTKVLANLVKTVAKALFMGAIDRLLGALFSVFQWMLVLSIALNICQIFTSHRVISSSKLAGGKVAEAVMDLAPTVFGFSEFPKIF